MSSNQRPSLVLAPSVNTTRVVTTTTTTTTYAPIPLPVLPAPPVPHDLQKYPLLNAQLPPSFRQFPLVFPNGSRATFRDSDDGDDVFHEEEVVGGKGWHLIKSEDGAGPSRPVGLVEAVERFGRKRSYGDDGMMEGIESTVEHTSHTPPPRKKAKAAPVLPKISTINAAAPPSPLPSPHGSPPPPNIWPSAPPSGASSPQPPQLPIQPDASLATLMSLPSLVTHYSGLPTSLQSHLLITLLRHSPLPVLRTVHSVLTPTLARDFLNLLPPELVSHVLSFLPFNYIARASRVSKSWRNIIDCDPILWRDLLKSEKLWFGGESERAFAEALIRRRRRAGLPLPDGLSLANPFKVLFKSRYLTRNRWITNPEPKHLAFPAHGRSVVTCLLLSRGRIISASDDHSIHVYSPVTGQLLRSLAGHEGGVWALASTKDTLVSGSTDRTVRIWDLSTGRCTHVFGGHTSTVRCLAIVKPEWVDVEDEQGNIRKEKWPKRPLIVTGSRDHSLRVWVLPRPGEPEYRFDGADEADIDPADEDVDENPYHKLHLVGHEHAVRALAARGRTLVSGSYDSMVRVWDIITGTCKWILVGHTQKVYSVVLDSTRNQACSGSMDGTVRVWNLRTGECQHTLTGHTSLVGLLGLSPSHLVSAAADSTLRIWDPDTGEVRHMLAAHTGAITCFQHDEFKVLSGSDGTLKMWDVREGTIVREFLSNIHGVWQVVFEGRWCVAASHRSDATILDVWDFGNGEEDEDWIGEPVGGIYDEDMTDDEDEEMEQADADAMDQDLDILPSETDMAEDAAAFPEDAGVSELTVENVEHGADEDWGEDESQGEGASGPSRRMSSQPGRRSSSRQVGTQGRTSAPSSSTVPRLRPLLTNDETPTRPRLKNALSRRR
ncbi:WD40-repeat-containing domain protein [Gloeopeniophorella convolvens]|nr:WD40-repeat-containing domain protein [Gloeopeniophorella convolvens]